MALRDWLMDTTDKFGQAHPELNQCDALLALMNMIGILVAKIPDASQRKRVIDDAKKGTAAIMDEADLLANVVPGVH